MSKMTRTAWGLDTLPDGEWLQHAACTPDTAELFDVLHGAATRTLILRPPNEKALRICRDCPVIRQCLDDALAHPNDYWFVAGGNVVHRGQIVPARPAGSRHTVRSLEAKAVAEALPEPAVTNFTEAVADLLGLGWSVTRIAEALGIGVTAVRQHALIGGR